MPKAGVYSILSKLSRSTPGHAWTDISNKYGGIEAIESIDRDLHVLKWNWRDSLFSLWGYTVLESLNEYLLKRQKRRWE